MRRLVPHLVALAVALLLATCGGESDAGGIHSIEVSPAFLSLAVGETTTLKARALDARGHIVEGTTFAWTDGEVAAIESDEGDVAVKAMRVGTQEIVAEAAGVRGVASISVSAESDARVFGRVIDGATEDGLADAIVAYSLRGGEELGKVATAADGTFSFRITPPSSGPRGTLDLSVTRTGYVATTLRGATLVAPTTQLATILLVAASEKPGSIAGIVRDARSNRAIASATLHLAEGQIDDDVSPTPIATTTSGSDGRYRFDRLAAGTYTLYGAAPGFREGQRTVITVPSGADVQEDLILSPDTLDVRVVLTWGATPTDLDLHVTGPNADGSRFLVFGYLRGDASNAPYASLDVDSRSSYGPETITITRLASGIYRFAVHDFTNRALVASTSLAQSGAKVELYTRRGVERFYVPNVPGNVWTVFELGGDLANPTITRVDAMSDASDAESIP